MKGTTGSGIKISFDYRRAVGKIDRLANNIKSVRGNKEELYREVIYPIVVKGIPIDSGALHDSPIQEDVPHVSPKYGQTRYSSGGITEDGIIFDPYTITGDGKKYHYGRHAYFESSWTPYSTITDNIDTIAEGIKDRLLEDV